MEMWIVYLVLLLVACALLVFGAWRLGRATRRQHERIYAPPPSKPPSPSEGFMREAAARVAFRRVAAPEGFEGARVPVDELGLTREGGPSTSRVTRHRCAADVPAEKMALLLGAAAEGIRARFPDDEHAREVAGGFEDLSADAARARMRAAQISVELSC